MQLFQDYAKVTFFFILDKVSFDRMQWLLLLIPSSWDVHLYFSWLQRPRDENIVDKASKHFFSNPKCVCDITNNKRSEWFVRFQTAPLFQFVIKIEMLLYEFEYHKQWARWSWNKSVVVVITVIIHPPCYTWPLHTITCGA